MLKYIILIIGIFFITSCNKADEDEVVVENGVITSQPYNWKKSRHDSTFISGNMTVLHNVVHNRSPLVNVRNNAGEATLRKVDSSSGEDIWSWSDYFIEGESAGLSSYEIIDERLLWVIGSRHYCVDIYTGNTIWKHRTDHSAWYDLDYLDEHYYFIPVFSVSTLDTVYTEIYQGVIETGEIRPYLVYTEIVTSGQEGDIRQTSTDNLTCFNQGGDNYILLDGRDPHPGVITQRHLSLYNMSTESWIYQKVPIGKIEGTNTGNLIIKDGLVFVAAGRLIESYDVMTGIKRWSKEFPHTFSFSGITVVGDKVIGNCENKTMYCLDASTGGTLWTGEGAGTSCDILDRELNGVLYFAGGAPNRLFAIDLDTGKTLWKIKASEYEEFDALWEWDLYVVPAEGTDKGKVIICTNRNAYCFDAIR